MKRTLKRIGILGGSFNPIHKGHLGIAKKAVEVFDLDEVIFVPTGLPPHKDPKELEDKEARYQMVLKAIHPFPNYRASRVELDRKGYCYAIDTLNRLKQELGEKNKLYYIVGMDSINEILEWKKPLELFDYCDFIVATRPKTKIRTLKRLLKFPPLSARKSQITVVEVRLNLSATEIRDMLKNGKSIKKLVPASVADYIERHGLYK